MGELRIYKSELSGLNASSSGVKNIKPESPSLFMVEYSKNDDSFVNLDVLETKDAGYNKKTYDVVMKQVLIHNKCKSGKIKDVKDSKKREDYQKLSNRESKRVTEKCKKYHMPELSSVIAFRLGEETGGYVYPGESKSKKSLHSHSGKYFGSMQVNDDILKSIYGKNSDYEKYFIQDKKYIDAIKQKYKTIQKLKEKMKTDVDLGLEIGILAFRAKLRQAKGDVNKAHKMYCGRPIPANVQYPPKINIDKKG